jgi:VanZ family protein
VTNPVTEASDSGHRRGTVWAWGLAAAWALFVWGLGGDDLSLEGTSRFLGPLIRWLLPDVTTETSELIQFMIRKAAHVTEYGVLSFLILRAMVFAPGGATTRRIAAAAGLAIAFAAADETRQSLSALRLGSIYDVGLDSLGALAGVGFLLLLRRMLPGLGRQFSLLGPENSVSK